jgi:hypothetical protein
LIQIRDGVRIPILEAVPSLDAELASLVMKGIAPDPSTRFQTAQDYRAALIAWAEAAEHREGLLAEFLGRPRGVTYVPATVVQPPRFFSGPRGSDDPPSGTGAQGAREVATPSTVEDQGTTPMDRPADGEPTLGDGLPPSMPPPQLVRPHDDQPPPQRRSNVKAILVGAAVGVASAVALYAALRL